MLRCSPRFVAVLSLSLLACESQPVSPGLNSGSAAAVVEPTDPPGLAAAKEISATIQARHLLSHDIVTNEGGAPDPTVFPYPTILDPLFATSTSDDYSVAGVVHAGDAAIWTGHYLAAEAYRYAVTGSSDALENARRALRGIKGLVDVTAQAKPGLLARFLWPAAWSYSDQMKYEEGSHGVWSGNPGGVAHFWLGNATRDQYSGVFFGLSIAFSLINDSEFQTEIPRLVETMLDFLLSNGWNIVMPNGRVSSTFTGRADQQLTLLQIGRQVKPSKYTTTYKSYRTRYASSVSFPIRIECFDPHGGYYKFNLNHINLFNLNRLEPAETGSARTTYRSALSALRSCTGSHQNAHFNMIERGVTGSTARDQDTRSYLSAWLERNRRDGFVDNSATHPPSCGSNRACSVIPVKNRPPTDFLWQRSPFLVSGGKYNGRTETAGIDYILPYWMARYYGTPTP